MTRRFSFSDENLLRHSGGLAANFEAELVGSRIDLERPTIEPIGDQCPVDIHLHGHHVGSIRISHLEYQARLSGFELAEPAHAVGTHDRRAR